MLEIWLAFMILYNAGNPNPAAPTYRIVNTGPFTSREDCIVRVQTDIEGMKLYYQTQKYKVIDVFCVELDEEDSVLKIPLKET